MAVIVLHNPVYTFLALAVFISLYGNLHYVKASDLSTIRREIMKSASRHLGSPENLVSDGSIEESSGTFIVDLLNGKVFREGQEDTPLGDIKPLIEKQFPPRPAPSDESRGGRSSRSRGDMKSGSQSTSDDKFPHEGSDRCVVFYNTQQLCGVYTLPWAENGSARVCGAQNLLPPPPMPGVHATSRATLYSLLSIVSISGNFLLILAVLVSAGLQKPIYWLLAGLSSACVLLVGSEAVLLVPPTLQVYEEQWLLGEFPCYLSHTLSLVATVASTLFILLIALERYFASKTSNSSASSSSTPDASSTSFPTSPVSSVLTVKGAQVSGSITWLLCLAYGCCWVPFLKYDSCILSDGSPINRCHLRRLDIARAVMSVTEGFFLLALPLAAAVILLVQTTATAPKPRPQPHPIISNQTQNNLHQTQANRLGNPAINALQLGRPNYTQPVGGFSGGPRASTRRVVSSGYLMNQRFAMPPSSLTSNSSSLSSFPRNSMQRRKRNDKAVTDKTYNLVRLMLYVLVSYIMLAAPRRLMHLYLTSSPPDSSFSSPTSQSSWYLAQTVLHCLLFLNTAIFPFLVLSMSANMRRAVRKLLTPHSTRGRLFTHEASAHAVARRAREMHTITGGVNTVGSSVGSRVTPTNPLVRVRRAVDNSSVLRPNRDNAGIINDTVTGGNQPGTSGDPISAGASISFIHVSPSGQNLNRLSSVSMSRSVSVNSGGSNSNRNSSASSDSMHSYDPNNTEDSVFYSFAPPLALNNPTTTPTSSTLSPPPLPANHPLLNLKTGQGLRLSTMQQSLMSSSPQRNKPAPVRMTGKISAASRIPHPFDRDSTNSSSDSKGVALYSRSVSHPPINSRSTANPVSSSDA